MSQKLLKIILLSTLTIGFVILGILLVRNKNKKDATQILTNIENPFGATGNDSSFGSSSQNGSDGSSGENGQDEAEQLNLNFTTNDDTVLLVKISEEPSSGGTFYSEEREIILPDEPSENLIEGYDFTGYPTLKFGDDRKEVLDLKTVLNRQDPSPGLAVDNAFDTSLKTAVIEFQTKNNLKPDGIVGSGTYKALNDFQGIKPKVKKENPKELVRYVRFIERGTGYVFEKPINKNEPKRIVTDTSISKAYEAYFNSDASKVFVRYLKGSVIENILGNIVFPDIVFSDGVKKIGELKTKLLSNNITFVSPRFDDQKLVYIQKTNSGSDVVMFDFKTEQSKRVWSSSFSEWIPQYINDNIISLTTASSGAVPGNAYLLDIKNNSLKNIITNTSGLTTNVSPDGKNVIYSSYENGNLKTYLMNLSTGRVGDFSPTTLPEKCVWTFDSKTVYCGGPNSIAPAVYPDDWYKGEVLFTDSLWKVDVATNTSTMIIGPGRISTSVDMTNIKINKEGDYIIFINKHDQFLYGIDLSKI